jgi:ABC-type sugar transport system substrate-binding protein
VPTLDAQFWNSYVAFMKKGADELGVKLVVLNAEAIALDIRDVSAVKLFHTARHFMCWSTMPG